MNMTKQFKDWLIANAGVSADANDEAFKAAALAALNDGKLTVQKMADLTKVEPVEDPMKQIGDMVAKALAPIVTEVAELKKSIADKPAPAAGKDGDAGASAESMADLIDKQVKAAVGKLELDIQIEAAGNRLTPEKLFGGRDIDPSQSGTGGTPRVKAAIERYSSTKSGAVHTKHFPGMPATYLGKQLDHPSQADNAVIGAYFKWCAGATAGNGVNLRGLRMNEHDQQLLKYAIHEMPWSGYIGGDNGVQVDGRKLTELEKKGLLDDATSGGLEAAPIVFDDAVILLPVLFGELFPLVNVVPLPRGRRVEGFSIGNPTFTSGTAEGTEIGLFDTTGFIAAFDTSIYNAVGAMEIGNDFEDDSPTNIGAIVVQKYGEKAQEWLDNQIANGDGTTEPQGVFLASAITDIGNPAGGAGAAPQITDYETLMFGVAKQFRTAVTRPRQVFIANDTTYRRARSIAVGSADARRVFGMDHENYMLLEHPFKVQNDISNAKAGFFNLAHYRMYRRLGMQVRVETGGKELARANQSLIVVRMRWGGKLEQGGAGAYTDNMQA